MYRKLLRRMLKTVAILAFAGVAGIALILVGLWFEHGSPVTLPEPTGPFPVGRTIYHWVDASRTDTLAPDPDRKRELIAWVWYPAAAKPAAATVDYQRTPWTAASGPIPRGLLSQIFTRDPSKVHADSIPDADLAPGEKTYPIVLMKSGIGALRDGLHHARRGSREPRLHRGRLGRALQRLHRRIPRRTRRHEDTGGPSDGDGESLAG